MTPARRRCIASRCRWARDHPPVVADVPRGAGAWASSTWRRRWQRAPSLVPCYWHQHQLFCGKFLLEQRARGLTVGWLISPSVDGELGAMLVRRIGGAVIRGSSSHTGARALRDYYQALVKDNVSPGDHARRPARPALQVQARRAAAVADVRSPDAADGLRRLARLAHQVGQVRHSDALLRASSSRSARRATCRACSDAAGLERLQREMEATLRALFVSAREALRAPGASGA